MNPATASMTEGQTSEIIEARIDAQDVHFAHPIREFLELHGVTVFVNTPTALTAIYHVVVGDADFVKAIFDKAKQTAGKRLAVVWGNSDVFSLEVPSDVKVGLVDPKPLTKQAVEELFTFFFTSQATVLDIRTSRGPVERKPSAPVVTIPAEEPVIIEEDIPQEEASVIPTSDQERIGAIVADIFVDEKSHQHEKTKRGRPRKSRLGWGRVTFVFLLVLFAPFLWFIVSMGLSVGSLAYTAKLLVNGDGRAQYTATFASYWVGQAGASWGIVSSPLRWIGLTTTARQGERWVSLLTDVASAEEGIHELTTDGYSVASALFRGMGEAKADRPAIALVEKLRLSAASVHNHVGLAEAQLTNLLDENVFPLTIPTVYGLGTRGRTLLAQFRETSSFLEQFLALYPTIAGFSGKQTYLLLFQNSMELRPTGGFIGSIGILSVENGTVTDMTVQDVYAVDGQLKGHVAPPAPIANILNQEHWYLRDSNWDPDFGISGAQAAWFYEKETATRVDGVIGVSLPFFVDLLSATGTLELTDYPDRITAENFFGKALFYTQSEFFPGSTQKKDFLGAAATSLLLKLSSGKGVSAPAVFRALSRGFADRDVQLYFADSQVQTLVSHFGWGGMVWGREGCVGVGMATCVFDPVFVVEANLAVNKANAFVERSRSRQVTISEDGTIREAIILSYRNPSFGPPKDAGGTYRAYLQVIVPSGASALSVSVNGAATAFTDGKTRPAVPYAELVSRSGQMTIGIAFDVLSGITATVAVSYQAGGALTFGKGGSVYELYDQHQAGSKDINEQVTIRYPIFWRATQEGQEGQEGKEAFLAKDAQLEYNTPILGDRFIRVRFTK